MIEVPPFDPTSEALVIVVAGEEALREQLRNVLRAARIEMLALKSAAALSSRNLPDRPGCLVIHVQAQEPDAQELWAWVVESERKLPIVLVAAPDELPIAEKALMAAAVDLLLMPVRDEDAIDAIESAISQDTERRKFIRENRSLVATLNAYEAEVMAEMLKGLLNRQIAHKLAIGETAVKIHRGNIMRKLKAVSIADLARKIASIKTDR
jgi:FixJ family two-component response regulator